MIHPAVDTAISELKRLLPVDALILHGSFADGTFTDASDIDFLALCSEGGASLCTAKAEGYLVRCHTLNSAILQTDCNMPQILKLTVARGVIVYDPEGKGKLLMDKLEMLKESLPKIPQVTKDAASKWAEEMFVQSLPDTANGNCCRMRLLLRSLDVIFLMNDQYFTGRKHAIGILKRDAPEAFDIYMKALSDDADEQDLRRWVDAVVYQRWDLHSLAKDSEVAGGGINL
jgi:Nucleotidyltransferase domain.